MRRGKALRAAALVAVLATAPASYGTCVDNVCAPVGPVSISTERAGEAGTCLYIKFEDPAPWDWNSRNAGRPYVFWRTKGWGNTYPTDWDRRFCDLV